MPAKKKRNKDRKKDKSFEFVCVLYPDNGLHNLAYLKLTSYQYSALLCLHDKDVHPEDVIDKETGELKYKAGELKKPHYHCYMRFKNQRYINGIAEELGIENHLVEFLEEDFKSYAEYMLHWGKHEKAGKYMYDVDSFEGTLAGFAKEKLINEDKNLSLFKVYQFITSNKDRIDINKVTDWCFKNGYFGLLRSNHTLIDRWITAHNNRFCKYEFKTFER